VHHRERAVHEPMENQVFHEFLTLYQLYVQVLIFLTQYNCSNLFRNNTTKHPKFPLGECGNDNTVLAMQTAL
jgi:hypothetical protein